MNTSWLTGSAFWFQCTDFVCALQPHLWCPNPACAGALYHHPSLHFQPHPCFLLPSPAVQQGWVAGTKHFRFM